MGEGGDRLALHQVPLVHGPVQEPRGVEDLEPRVPDVEVAYEDPLRRERVWGDAGLRGAHAPHERALPHVRVARHDDRRGLRINVREPLQGPP